MHLKEITPPASEPITIEQARDWVSVVGDSHDDKLNALIKAAREDVEDITSRQMLTTVYELYMDEFTQEIKMPKPPIQSIASVNYIDPDDTDYTELASANWSLDDVSEPARLEASYSNSWPSTKDVMNAVKIRFTTGYSAASGIPERYKIAMRLFIEHNFYNRGEEGFRTMPKNYYDLLNDRISII